MQCDNICPKSNRCLFYRFWATVCKTVRPMLSDRCPVLSVCLSVCDVGVLSPNGWMDQNETWHNGRHRPNRHCIRWGPSSTQEGAQPPPPQFSAHVYCGQTAGRIKMKLIGLVGLGPGHTVLDGYRAPPTQRGTAPSFRPMSVVAKRLGGLRCRLVLR